MSTLVAPVLASGHVPGYNVVYCATFQLAWNVLADRFGGRVRLDPEGTLAAALNARDSSSNDVDPASCVAQAGFVHEGIVASIARELSAKFPGGSVDPFPEPLPAGAVVAFGYLQRALRYATRFAHADYSLRFGGVPVSSFGVWSEGGAEAKKRIASQVVVHDHAGPGDFVVELLSTSRDDRIVVARVAPGASLAETTSRALARLDGLAGTPAATFLPDDYLAIPSIRLDVECELNELIGTRVSDAGGAPIVRAHQSIRLKFDHEGAEIESSARFAAMGGSMVQRRFVCDGPFLLLLLRRGSVRPYLALWLENTGLLRTNA